jgi:hypothetical protein
MDEEQWLSCTDPTPMLEFLRDSGKLSERKARLFAVACCHLLDPGLLASEPARIAVEVAERYLDGLASKEELEAASRVVAEASYAPWLRIMEEVRPATQSEVREGWLARMARWASETRTGAAMRAVEVAIEQGWPARAGVPRWQEGLPPVVRDLFGNPFRPVTVDPAWLTWNDGTVRCLAEAAYQERLLPQGTLEPDRLAVLADALEEAGCGDGELLGHLRGPGPHYAGCWAVDLLSGRE